MYIITIFSIVFITIGILLIYKSNYVIDLLSNYSKNVFKKKVNLKFQRIMITFIGVVFIIAGILFILPQLVGF